MFLSFFVFVCFWGSTIIIISCLLLIEGHAFFFKAFAKEKDNKKLKHGDKLLKLNISVACFDILEKMLGMMYEKNHRRKVCDCVL